MSHATPIRRADQRRAEWLKEKPFCAVHLLNNEQVPATEPHHIASRWASQPHLYEHNWNYLRVCNECHRRITAAEISYASIVIAKAAADPEDFDMMALALRRRKQFAPLIPFNLPRE